MFFSLLIDGICIPTLGKTVFFPVYSGRGVFTDRIMSVRLPRFLDKTSTHHTNKHICTHTHIHTSLLKIYLRENQDEWMRGGREREREKSEERDIFSVVSDLCSSYHHPPLIFVLKGQLSLEQIYVNPPKLSKAELIINISK